MNGFRTDEKKTTNYYFSEEKGRISFETERFCTIKISQHSRNFGGQTLNISLVSRGEGSNYTFMANTEFLFEISFELYEFHRLAVRHFSMTIVDSSELSRCFILKFSKSTIFIFGNRLWNGWYVPSMGECKWNTVCMLLFS